MISPPIIDLGPYEHDFYGGISEDRPTMGMGKYDCLVIIAWIEF
jgi:hypothetical protein